MNRFISVLSVALMFFLLPSCFIDCTEGNGVIKTESRDVGEFTKLEIHGAYKVELTQADASKLVIKGDENLLPLIKTEIRGDKLIIDTEESICDHNIVLYVNAKTLELLDVSGAIEVVTKNHFVVNDFKLDGSGAINAKLDVEANTIVTDLSGAGEIEYIGKAETHRVDISGAAELDASHLTVNDYYLELSGASKCKINVNNKLKIDASGASEIQYTGNPATISQQSSGAASVSKMD